MFELDTENAVIFFARYDASQYGFAYIEAGFLIKKLLSIGVAKTFGHSSSTREPSGVDVIFPPGPPWSVWARKVVHHSPPPERNGKQTRALYRTSCSTHNTVLPVRNPAGILYFQFESGFATCRRSKQALTLATKEANDLAHS